MYKLFFLGAAELIKVDQSWWKLIKLTRDEDCHFYDQELGQLASDSLLVEGTALGTDKRAVHSMRLKIEENLLVKQIRLGFEKLLLSWVHSLGMW